VFIVHGRDHSVRDEIDLFLTKELHLSTVVMEAGPYSGRTLPEKFEEMAHEAAFAILILSADDRLVDQTNNRELTRARQNVILELGFFWGLLGRIGAVALLVASDPLMELPSDAQGLGWIPITTDLGETKRLLLRELRAAHLVP
jgi:predicted nucleotide-binding protein